MSAMKNDKSDAKSAMQYVHPDLWLGVGNAMAAGAIKYDDWNFLKGHGKLQLCAAILRHTAEIMKGNDIDEDTTKLLGRTVYHWDCVGSCINMMIWQRERGTLKQDLPLPVMSNDDALYNSIAPHGKPLTMAYIGVGDRLRVTSDGFSDFGKHGIKLGSIVTVSKKYTNFFVVEHNGYNLRLTPNEVEEA